MANKERSSSHNSRASLIDRVMSLKLCFPFYKPSFKMESPSSPSFKMESASSHISKSLSLLEEQEEKYHILFLKLGLHFLEMFLCFSNNEDLYLIIQDELYDVRLELHSLSKRPIKGSHILNLDRVYSNLREKMKDLLIRQNFERRLVNYEWVFGSEEILVRISRYLLSCGVDLNIKGKLTLLQALFTYLAVKEVYISWENEGLLTHLASLLHKATCLIYFCFVDQMDKEIALAMKQELSDLVEKTNVEEIYMLVLRASRSAESTSEHYLLDNLIKLLDCNEKFVIYLSDPSKNLFEKLKFLQTFIRNLPDELRLERFNYHFTSIEAIIWKLVPILCSCYDRDINEEMAREVSIAVSEVLYKIKQIQETRELKLYNYPKVDAMGFLDLFLGHLEELLKCRPESIEILKNQIETLHMEFKFLRSSLMETKGQRNEHEELGDLRTRFIGLAYQAEYVIDLYLVKNALDSRIIMSLSKIIEQTKLIKTEVSTINTKKKYHTQAHDVEKTSTRVSSKATDITTDEIVGFEDEAKKIKEYLFEDQEKLDIISIVGMPGVGKTTLAKKVYEDPSILEFFHVQAWCTVSQTYQKRELLLTILGDVTGTLDNKAMNDEDLAAMLFRSLKGRRYLIVIDDLWDIKDWDDFKRSFPDDRLRSRILITSRYHNLASQIKDGNKVHTLREFSDVKSWELFAKKLFQKGSFSREFLVVGQQIIESCKGLPLTIVVIAGVLARVDKSVHKWKQIAQELSSHIFSDSESQCRAILELSYNHLPDHLKSCFLYFAAFPEDEEIPLWKLKLLWIAEGFLRYTEGEKLEDVAETYFVDLINRSLVIPTKESSHGGVKACRVHDLLHDFCLQKAKEGSFLRVIHVHDWSDIARVYEERRLSIDFKKSASIEAKPSHYNVRSLLYTRASGFSVHSSDISFIIKNFMLLRVLDLADISISMSYSGIKLLTHLRYLAVKTDSMPSSIANLWYLQSLIVNGSWRNFEPNSLWNMVNLRHLRINHHGSFRFSTDGLENSSLLDNVQTLSTPCFVSAKDVENFLRRVPNLRKLRCEFYNCWEDLGYDLHRFPDLSFLDQLVSLKLRITSSREWRKNCVFYFPPNLQKLSLSGSLLPKWKDIAEFGRNLKVLKLSGTDCDAEWIVNDGDFPNLEYLKLSDLWIDKWIASEDSFPKLAQLMSHASLWFTALLMRDSCTGTPQLQSNVESSLYRITVPLRASSLLLPFSVSHVSSSLWHSHRSHTSKQVSSLQTQQSLNFSDLRSLNKVCTACMMGKSHKLAFPLSSHISKFPLKVVHCDVWGPAPTTLCSGFCYFVLFIDDYSRYT